MEAFWQPRVQFLCQRMLAEVTIGIPRETITSFFQRVSYPHRSVYTGKERPSSRCVTIFQPSWSFAKFLKTYTVEYDRENRPQLGHVVCRLKSNGHRLIANHGDIITLEELSSWTEEPIGRIGFVRRSSTTTDHNLFVFRKDDICRLWCQEKLKTRSEIQSPAKVYEKGHIKVYSKMRYVIRQLKQSQDLEAEENIHVKEYTVLNNARIKSLIGVEVLPMALIQPKSRVLFLFLQGLTALATKS